jgi:hypothetical protein
MAVMYTCRKMKADQDKSRVALYYLLAERYGVAMGLIMIRVG